MGPQNHEITDCHIVLNKSRNILYWSCKSSFKKLCYNCSYREKKHLVEPPLQLLSEVVVINMSYLHYVCLFAYSGVQHILRCVFVLFVFILSALCCRFLRIAHFFCLLCIRTWSGSAAVCAKKIGRYLILKTGVYNRNIMKGICSDNWIRHFVCQ
jgi:hypothetical protein